MQSPLGSLVPLALNLWKLRPNWWLALLAALSLPPSLACWLAGRIGNARTDLRSIASGRLHLGIIIRLDQLRHMADRPRRGDADDGLNEALERVMPGLATLIEHDDAAGKAGDLDAIAALQKMGNQHDNGDAKPNRPCIGRQQRDQEAA